MDMTRSSPGGRQRCSRATSRWGIRREKPTTGRGPPQSRWWDVEAVDADLSVREHLGPFRPASETVPCVGPDLVAAQQEIDRRAEVLEVQALRRLQLTGFEERVLDAAADRELLHEHVQRRTRRGLAAEVV